MRDASQTPTSRPFLLVVQHSEQADCPKLSLLMTWRGIRHFGAAPKWRRRNDTGLKVDRVEFDRLNRLGARAEDTWISTCAPERWTNSFTNQRRGNRKLFPRQPK